MLPRPSKLFNNMLTIFFDSYFVCKYNKYIKYISLYKRAKCTLMSEKVLVHIMFSIKIFNTIKALLSEFVLSKINYILINLK